MVKVSEGRFVNATNKPTVEEIRKARAKITAPPWVLVAGNDYFVEAPETIVKPPLYVDANMARPAVCKTVVEVSNQSEDCGEADAEFIANAPRYVDLLLSEVDRLKAELVALKHATWQS